MNFDLRMDSDHTPDAGLEREALVKKIVEAAGNVDCSCFADCYDKFEKDFRRLAVLTGLPEGKIFASIMDDINANETVPFCWFQPTEG